MGIEFDAGILVGKRRLRIGIHQHAAFAFPEVAIARGLRVGRDRRGAEAEQAGIEAVLESPDIRSAPRRAWLPAAAPDRPCSSPPGCNRRACREKSGSGAPRPRYRRRSSSSNPDRTGCRPANCTPDLFHSFVEALEAGVERGLSAARKSHQHDALRIDARMFCEDFQRAVDVDDEIEPAEQGLVRPDRRQPAAGEAVDHKVEIPMALNCCTQGSMLGTDAARSVHHHHDGEAPLPCAMRNSPATVTCLPLASPVRNCWSEIVSDGIA